MLNCNAVSLGISFKVSGLGITSLRFKYSLPLCLAKANAISVVEVKDSSLRISPSSLLGLNFFILMLYLDVGRL